MWFLMRSKYAGEINLICLMKLITTGCMLMQQNVLQFKFCTEILGWKHANMHFQLIFIKITGFWWQKTLQRRKSLGLKNMSPAADSANCRNSDSTGFLPLCLRLSGIMLVIHHNNGLVSHLLTVTPIPTLRPTQFHPTSLLRARTRLIPCHYLCIFRVERRLGLG